MKVPSINNYSFTGSKKADENKTGGKRNFEYLSKMEANKALKLSKGREEKDGKFKFAQGVSALGAVVTGYSSLVLGEKLGTQYIRHFDP